MAMTGDVFLKKLKKRSGPCLTATRKPKITLADSKPSSKSSRLHIKNEGGEEIYTIKVDGCLFEEGKPPQRCDWVLYSADHKKILFIELKSSNIKDCVEQFEESITVFGDCKKISYFILVHRSKNFPEAMKKMKRKKLKFKAIQAKRSSTKRASKLKAERTLANLLDFEK